METGRHLLETISDAFLGIAFALMSNKEPPDGAKSALEYAVERLKKVREDVRNRLKEHPEWENVEKYFQRYPLYPDKSNRTLFYYMRHFETVNPQNKAERQELQALSGAIANRVLNMLGWIRDDAEKASEPFLSLLR